MKDVFRFESLEIWHLAIEHCSRVYDIVERLPKGIPYTLGSQLRESSLSISNNIAEGSGSSLAREFKSFLNYSVRSLYETVSALFILKKKCYIDQKVFSDLYQDSEILVKKIRAFRKKL